MIRSRTPSFTDPLLLWTRLAWETGEMMLASAQVIGHRTGRMAAVGSKPNASDRREFALMGQEKIEAAAKSAHGMAAHMMTMDPSLGARAVQQALAAATAMMSRRGKPHRQPSPRPASEARPHHDAVRGHHRTALRCDRPARPARAQTNTLTSDGQRQTVGQTLAANAYSCATRWNGGDMTAVATVCNQINETRASSPEQT